MTKPSSFRALQFLSLLTLAFAYTPGQNVTSSPNINGTANKDEEINVEQFGQPLPADKFELLCNLTKPNHVQALCANATDHDDGCKILCIDLGFTTTACTWVRPDDGVNITYNVCGCSYSAIWNQGKTVLWYFITGIDLKPSESLITDQQCKSNGYKVIYTKKNETRSPAGTKKPY